MNGFRAYFHLLGDVASVKSFAMTFSDGETTSIHNSQFTISNDEAGAWYDRLSEVESNIDGLNGYDKNGGDQGSAWVKRGGDYNVWNDDWSQ